MRYVDLLIIAGNKYVQVFKALKRFDPDIVLGPTLALLRAGEPLHIDANCPDRLKLFTNLLQLLDDLSDIQVQYKISVTKGPPQIVDGKPVWASTDGSRADIADMVETETRRKAEREHAEAFLRTYKAPEPPSLTLLHKRWEQLGFAALLPSEKNHIYLWWLKVEVENGTFHQYFFNSYGDHALEALAALRFLGAKEASSILEEAVDLFKSVGGFTPDRYSRWKLLEMLPQDVFETVTNKFYARTEDLVQWPWPQSSRNTGRRRFCRMSPPKWPNLSLTHDIEDGRRLDLLVDSCRHND